MPPVTEHQSADPPPPRKYAALLAFIKPEWHAEFEKFMDTGTASEAFLDYLDEDPGCQQAVDTVFEQEVERLHALGAALEKGLTAPAAG